MAEWLFNSKGFPCLILDTHMIRNNKGYVIGWLNRPNVFSSHGVHIGWFEGGVVYDITNCPLLFLRNHTSYLPGTPGLTGTSAMSGFATPPGKPGFQGARTRPGLAQRWSNEDPLSYFQ